MAVTIMTASEVNRLKEEAKKEVAKPKATRTRKQTKKTQEK